MLFVCVMYISVVTNIYLSSHQQWCVYWYSRVYSSGIGSNVWLWKYQPINTERYEWNRAEPNRNKKDGTRSCSLHWRHNERDGVSDHQPHEYSLNRLFGRRWKRTPKLRVTGLCAGYSPVTGEIPAQMASNAQTVFIWWLHHVYHWQGVLYTAPNFENHLKAGENVGMLFSKLDYLSNTSVTD